MLVGALQGWSIWKDMLPRDGLELLSSGLPKLTWTWAADWTSPLLRLGNGTRRPKDIHLYWNYSAIGRLRKDRVSPTVMKGLGLASRVLKWLALGKMPGIFALDSPFLRAVVNCLLPARICYTRVVLNIAGHPLPLSLSPQKKKKKN